MKHKIAIQHGTNTKNNNIFEPLKPAFRQWVNAGLNTVCYNAEVCLRIVDKQEIQSLNNTYRKKNKPTNVLSFPSELPEIIEQERYYLGDIILCAEIIQEEAVAQNKSPEAHWAHMVLHGLLHLRGYDHIHDEEATIMESIEIQLLEKLGFPNPYENHIHE